MRLHVLHRAVQGLVEAGLAELEHVDGAGVASQAERALGGDGRAEHIEPAQIGLDAVGGEPATVARDGEPVVAADHHRPDGADQLAAVVVNHQRRAV